MSVDVATLGIAVDSRQVRQGAQDLDRLAEHGDRSERRVTTATGQMQSSFERLRAQIFSVQGLMATFGVGFSARAIINAVAEQEHVTAQLEARLRSTGGVAGQTMRSMQALGAQMQQTTKFSNEQVESAQALLLTFTRIRGDVFPATIRAAADLATAMGTDLNSAIQQVGRALNDPIAGLGALTRSGVQFTDAQRDLIASLMETNQVAEAQRVILEELEAQFGGSAEAARDTLGGAIAGLRNEFDDLLKTVGQGAPLQRGVEFMADNFQTLVSVGTVLVGLYGVRMVASLAATAAAKLAAAQQAIAYQAALARMAGQSYAAAVATDTLRRSMALVGGPAGIVLIAAGALMSWGMSARAAGTDGESLRQEVDALTKSMEELRASRIEDAMLRVQQRMQEVEETIRRNNRGIMDMGGAGSQMAADMVAKNAELRDEARRLTEDYAALEDQLSRVGQQALGGAPEGTGGSHQAMEGVGDSAVAAYRERIRALDDYIAKLEQERDLLAVSTRAERARYDIASGALGQLNKLQQQQVIALAEETDRKEELIKLEQERERQAGRLIEQIEREAEVRRLADMDAVARQEEAFEIQLENLRNFREMEILTQEEFDEYEKLAFANHQAELTEIQRQEAENRAQAEARAQQQIQQMRMQTYQMGVGLLQSFAGQSEAAAYAAIGLNALLMGMQTKQNTAAAVMRAYAELGPVAGPPAAASIQKLGAAQLAIIGATAAVQASQVGPGGAASGSAANPVHTQPAAPPPVQQQPQQQAAVYNQVIIQGDVSGTDGERIMGEIKELIDNGDHTLFSENSRQAQILRGS